MNDATPNIVSIFLGYVVCFGVSQEPAVRALR